MTFASYLFGPDGYVYDLFHLSIHQEVIRFMTHGQTTTLDRSECDKVDERRIHPRKNVTLRVDYTDSGGRACLGLARNLSFGGMFLEYTPALTVGDIVTTAFVLPSGRPYRLQARVVHRNETGSGLSFLHDQENELSTRFEYLEAYCAA